MGLGVDVGVDAQGDGGDLAEFGGDAFRLLGFWDAGRLIILTNGFAKKTQKTPEREIKLAGQRKRDYLNRKAKRPRFRKATAKAISTFPP